MKVRLACVVILSVFGFTCFMGCQQPSTEVKTEVKTGVAISPDAELPVGAQFADFEYNIDGQIKTLMSSRGQFTIIAFTSCDEAYNPSVTQLSKFIQSKTNWLVKVVGIDVFWKSGECVQGKQCAALPQYANKNFIAICDKSGVIRDAYNVTQSGRYFIIDDDGKIAAKGDVKDLDGLRTSLSKLIDSYMKEQEQSLKGY